MAQLSLIFNNEYWIFFTVGWKEKLSNIENIALVGHVVPEVLKGEVLQEQVEAVGGQVPVDQPQHVPVFTQIFDSTTERQTTEQLSDWTTNDRTSNGMRLND